MLVKKNTNKSYLYFALLCIGLIVLLLFFKGSSSIKEKIIPEIVRNTSYKPLQIILKEKHYKKIKKKRDFALTIGVLETKDEDFVPAVIIYNEEKYNAQVRLKGDWTDHLAGIKWSYRVKLEGEKTIQGMKKFSIHHPGSRGYLNEWLYHKAIKQEGIMGLRYGFLEGIMHVAVKELDTTLTRNAGIYAIEETFDKRLIENNNRKAGVILKLTEENMWHEIAMVNEVGNLTGTASNGKYNKKYTTDAMTMTTYSLSKVIADTVLNKQFYLAKNLLNRLRMGDLKISQVFDIEKTAKFTAIANLFGGYHGLNTHNLRFYYNPITSLIEPIAFDGNSGLELKEFRYYWNSENDAIFKESLILALEEVCDINFLEKLIEKNKTEMDWLFKDLEDEFGKEPILSLDILRENHVKLKKILLNLKG